MRAGKDIALVLLSITTVAGVWLAWAQSRELQRLQQSAAPSNSAVSSNAAAPAQMAPEAMPEPVMAAARPAAAVPAVAPERQTQDEARRLRQEEMMRVQETPEFQRLRALQHKGFLDQRFATLFRQLGLAPDKLEALKNLLVERDTVGMDVNAAARAQGLDPRTDAAALRQLVDQTRAEVDAGIRNLLGEDAYATFIDYQQTMPYRDVVNALDLRLSYTASPLTDAQAEQLVKIVVDTNRDPGLPGNANVINFRRIQTSLNDETMNRARGILTPEQYVALEELQTRQQAQHQMGELMRPAIGRNAVPAVMLPTGGD